jgi:hypothetical protein
MLRVLAEVRDEFFTREILGVMAWNGVMSQPRESTHCMKVQTVVPPCPGSTELLILLENDRVDSPPPERARGGQACRPCANDDDCGFWQRNVLSKRSV